MEKQKVINVLMAHVKSMDNVIDFDNRVKKEMGICFITTTPPIDGVHLYQTKMEMKLLSSLLEVELEVTKIADFERPFEYAFYLNGYKFFTLGED
jgi:hypothetical protein